MSTEPLLELGDNTELDENSNGEPVLRHKPSGAEFKFDSANGNWKPTADIDMGGRDIKNGGSLSAEALDNIEFVNEHASGGSGTPTDPWVDGHVSAAQAAADTTEGIGTVFLPAGVYLWTQSLDLFDYYRPRESGPAGTQDQGEVPNVLGSGVFATTVVLDDNVDPTAMLNLDLRDDTDDTVPAGKDINGPTIGGFMLLGNRTNNTTGSGLTMWNDNQKRVTNTHVRDIYFRDFPDYGLDQSEQNSRFTRIKATRAGESCIRINGAKNELSTVEVRNGYNWGLEISGGRNTISSFYIDQCDNFGLVITGDQNVLDGGYAEGNNLNGNEAFPYYIDGDENNISDFTAIASSNRSTYLMRLQTGSTDNDLDIKPLTSGSFVTDIDDRGTRTRWQGVIGDGPLGGVDLSATTGQWEKDIAVSSGATANTGDNPYSEWRWDSANSVWNDGNGNTV